MFVWRPDPILSSCRLQSSWRLPERSANHGRCRLVHQNAWSWHNCPYTSVTSWSQQKRKNLHGNGPREWNKRAAAQWLGGFTCNVCALLHSSEVVLWRQARTDVQDIPRYVYRQSQMTAQDVQAMSCSFKSLQGPTHAIGFYFLALPVRCCKLTYITSTLFWWYAQCLSCYIRSEVHVTSDKWSSHAAHFVACCYFSKNKWSRFDRHT